MAEALFYHLTESRLDETLPGLVQRSLQRGWRAAVQTGSLERRDALDTLFWTYSDDSFLAHGLDSEPNADQQPVLLTATPSNANGATVRFFVDGAEPGDLDAYQRVVFLFDGYDEAELASARERWKSLKAAGHQVTYWQQTAERGWERKA